MLLICYSWLTSTVPNPVLHLRAWPTPCYMFTHLLGEHRLSRFLGACLLQPQVHQTFTIGGCGHYFLLNFLPVPTVIDTHFSCHFTALLRVLREVLISGTEVESIGFTTHFWPTGSCLPGFLSVSCHPHYSSNSLWNIFLEDTFFFFFPQIEDFKHLWILSLKFFLPGWTAIFFFTSIFFEASIYLFRWQIGVNHTAFKAQVN